MVKIADIHVVSCPKCHAEIASRAGVPQAGYYGLANEFSCKKCGHHIMLSPQERMTRDYVTSLADRRKSFALKLLGTLAVVFVLLDWLVVYLFNLPLIAVIPIAFVSFLIVAFITTTATKSQIG